MGTGSRFRILGPLEVWDGDQPVVIAGVQPRAVLALLLLEANRVVSADRLIDGLWGERAAPNARLLLHGCVARLRRALRAGGGGQPLSSRSPGYLIQVGDDDLDLTRFDRLADAAAGTLRDPSAAGLDRARGLPAEALSLWRGPALDGLNVEAIATAAAGLQERRLAVLEQRIDVDLRLGGHPVLVGELRAHVRAHPLRERLWAQLMVALAGSGRQADALAAYRQLRATLVDQLGIEPGPLSRQLHQVILAGGDATADYLQAANPPAAELPAAAASPPPVAAAASPPPPAQLPLDVYGFTGRDGELAKLDAVLTAAAGQPTAVVISAVSGTAGVGKTALAVHWAHRVRDRFPDGQLYVNLRGFDPGGRIMEPAAAVRGFLEGLGVPAERIPTTLDAQVGLYRSLLAGRRMLVVIDNARDADHARPLLPGTGTAVAVVTSRSQLTPLLAADGAHPITLDLLTPDEARDLLARRLALGRVAAEPQAVEQIIAACARLPLALAIAAARAQQSTFPLATLAAELTDAGRRLDTLDAGNPTTQIQAVFSWSYTTLTPPAARLFRLLGLHPGPNTSTPAAASLTGLPLPQTRRLLTELVRAGLLGEQEPGRYRFHDLLRDYATHLTHTDDTDQDREAATVRLLDHYTHTAHSTVRQLRPARDPIPVPLTPPALGATPEPVPDQLTALAWLNAERPVLLTTQQLAGAIGRDTHAWQLAWTLDTTLTRQGRWQELVGAWQTALPAAGRLPHPAAATAHRLLGAAATRLGDDEQAHTHLQHALRLHTEAADPVGQANTHILIGVLWERRGRPERALYHAEQALTLYQATGHRSSQANALNAVGWYHTVLGDHIHALTYCQQALTLHQRAGNRDGEAATWDSLGYANHHLNHHTQATDCYQHALTLYRDLGDRYYEADVLTHLGDTLHAAGHPDQARTAWTTALAILTDLDHPDTDTIRAKLARLDQQPTPSSGSTTTHARTQPAAGRPPPADVPTADSGSRTA
jgi:DNA-binding SARP family transcriptional activator/tetratricopeptide (TPR) repeat protein